MCHVRVRFLLANLLFGMIALQTSTHTLAQSDTPETSAAENEILLQEFEALTGKDKSAKYEAIKRLAESDAPAKERWLDALMAGTLYRVKKEQEIVIARKNDDGKYEIFNAVDGTSLGIVKKRKLRRIALDNKQRSSLRVLRDGMALQHSDSNRRLEAVNGLIGNASDEQVELVREFLTQEEDPDVAEAMTLLVNLRDLQHGDASQQRKALNYVDGNISPDVVNALKIISLQPENPELQAIAVELLQKANKKISLYRNLETLIFGLSLGSVLVLAAIGLAITFGVMGVINMAHGELIMLGAYTTYFVQQWMPNASNYSLLVALPLAFIVAGASGMLIERLVIRHLYGRPLETLLATFGISLLLQQLVRTFVSPQNVPVVNPSWMTGSWQLNSALSLTYNRLYILFFCLLVFAFLVIYLSKSRFGLQMRSVSQNRQMASAMGIPSRRIDCLTFGLGAGIAGIAGVALSQIGNVGPNLGQGYIIDSFMVVVFGGVGNLWGTLVAGMSLGIANKFLEPVAGAVLAKILVLVFIILFIQRRPRGLFPQLGRAVES